MFYAFACLCVRVLLRILTVCRVTGLENVPAEGPLLLVSNHLNLVDPPVLGALLPRRIAFMAKEELFPLPVVGWAVKAYGGFPVKRGRPDRQALRTAVGILGRGGVVGMFPEGTRSRTGAMIEAHPGAALIALLSGAPVLPVAITGTDRLGSPLALRSRPEIRVRVGKPFVLQRREGEKTDLESATRRMMAIVAAMLPEERRGHYTGGAPDHQVGNVAREDWSR